MRRYVMGLSVMLLPSVALAGGKASVYVCAHPDDCFLFMSPNLYDDVGDATNKVVVVYLTSGDAGMPFAEKDSSYPYARELASLEATEWMADVGKGARGKQEAQTVTVDGHKIAQVKYANTVSYFMRLPDGNMYGDGFGRYGHASLHKLKTGEIKSMAPIDGKAAYEGWHEVVSVLSGVVARETADVQDVSLHIAEPDVTLKTNDHSDHTAGANGMLEALALGAGHCFTLYKHIDYAIDTKPENIDGVSVQNKSGAFAVLTDTQRRVYGHYSWDGAHLPYLVRNYFSTTTLPKGCDKR